MAEMNFDVNSETVMNDIESFEICKDIMEDVLNDLLDNLDALEASEAAPTIEAPQPFFKTLSFYDDPDDDPMLPFESFFGNEDPSNPLLEVPSEFTQPFFNSTESSAPFDDSDATIIATSILDAILDAVPPRKIATVHPFSLNNKDEEPETCEPPPGLRLAGFATDPATSSSASPSQEVAQARPTLKFANFAVDPGSSSSSSGGGLKLANFAVDPDAAAPSWHTRDSEGPTPSQPPPLTQRPELQASGSNQMFSPPVGPASRASPQLPSLTRAPNSTEVGATPPPPAGTQNLACFGHFERELEYRYCFR